MIFLTVGTHPQQFDRLLKKVDELIEKGIIKEEVFGQIGHTDYKPKNYKYEKFIGLEEFGKRMKEANLIITHGGEGNIGMAIQLKKNMVIVPRLKKFGEHTNDHQLELAEASKKAGYGIVIEDVKKIEEAIEEAKKFKVRKKEEGKIAELIENFIGVEFGK
jgi:UDP-N-acetylglucosamine transferase subunit ALG13